jgi:hypothetical protein
VLTQRSPLVFYFAGGYSGWGHAKSNGPMVRGWRTPRDPPQRSTDCTGRCLGQGPAEEILFDWFRSGRLVVEEAAESRYRARGSCPCIQQAAWRRLLRPSFPSRLWTCDLVVASPIMSRFDISLLLIPSLMS